MESNVSKKQGPKGTSLGKQKKCCELCGRPSLTLSYKAGDGIERRQLCIECMCDVRFKKEMQRRNNLANNGWRIK